MKRMKLLFCAISFICMFTGCSKVYEVEFENLLLEPVSDVLNTPDCISGCRIEIKTSDKFNIDEYSERCRNIVGAWSYEEDYSYMNYWGDNSGVFEVPSGKGQISIYSNSEKILDLKYDEGKITSSKVRKKGDIVCEFTGTLDVGYECERTMYYFLQGKLIWYNNDSDLYMQKKVVTEGYAPNCKQYDEITHYYYPTGIVSHKIVRRYQEDESCYEGSGYSSETLEDVYYNRDGSEMTMADRLFENHEEYVILNTGYNNWRKGNFYIVLMPKENGNTKGYGAIISSDDYNLSSFIIDKTFEYRIDDNEIICDEFFYHSKWEGTGRVKNQKRRTLEIDIDYYKKIIVKGEFVINGWEVDCNMRPSQEGYSDWLYTTIQNDYIRKR